VPHLGHGSLAPAAPGPGIGPDAGRPAGLPPVPAVIPLPGLPLPGLPAMRMPHMSQKSSLAESCPLGQIAIGASWKRCRLA